jgi:hypothetical protein
VYVFRYFEKEIEMKNGTLSALMLAVMAGTVIAGDTPVEIDATEGELRHAGHLYFNVSTGERLITMIDGVDAQRGVNGGEGEEIWVIGGEATGCPDGAFVNFFFGLDGLTDNYGAQASPMLLDWGDIENNTVVDCVQVHWVTDHADTDTDSDGFADGVEGFGATWTFWDGMNGRSPQLDSIALPIVDFTFFNLPGEYPVDTATLAFYTADVDLGGTFTSTITFEIGDDDSDLNGAAVHNPRMDLNDADSDSVPDIDPDGDGLADWGWSIDFIQPGTVDFDNADSDSDSQTGVDGDINAFATAGVVFGLPQPGMAEFDSVADAWDWVPGPGAPSVEDAFGLVDGGVYDGPYFFGGFNCEPYTPMAAFSIVLYGPPTPFDCGDLAGNPDGTPDGVLNFLDISAFLSYFAQGDLIVDYAGNPDGSPDGVLNFLDVSAYLTIFAAGCP